MRRARWRWASAGTALAIVLLASAVLLVVCFSLAAVAVLNLNLSGSYSTRSESLLLAEAAVHQVVAELERAQQEDTGNSSELRGNRRVDLLARFSRPVFLEGAERFPGDVRITFDAHQHHFSVDNSYNDAPAAGWPDRGSARKSVPPFSISLVIGVTLNGRTTFYEGLLRRRWPYVLCTPGRVTLMGAPTYARDGKTGTIAPSQVVGNIFSLPHVSFLPSPAPGSTPRSEPDDSHIFVDAPLIRNLLGVMPQGRGIVSVGGTAQLNTTTLRGAPPNYIQITSTGNSLTGSVDVAGLAPNAEVEVYPGNTHVGSLRRDVKPFELARNLQAAFQIPNLGEYRELEMQGAPPGTEPEPPPTPDVPDGLDPSGFPTVRPSPRPTPSPSPGETPEPPPPFFVLFRDLVLQGPSSSSFQFDPAARFKISMPCGNRYIVRGNRHDIYYTGAGIELHNCILYIQGNLDLSSTRPKTGEEQIMPALRGTNATIIVDGTLILNNGYLSATNEGMVIYCRRLVSAAQGQYRGLIMVQKSAAICPAYPGALMEIQGGVVCGGEPVALYALDPNYDPDRDEGSDTVNLYLQGLHLWSTRLTYDSRYLKTLNRFGPLNVLSLRQIE